MADNDNDIPKPQPPNMAKKDENKDQEKKEDEYTVEEIERELDTLRPPPASPKTRHRIEQEEREKDREVNERKTHKTSSPSPDVKSDDNQEKSHHKDNELTPGEPDPTVNDNTKIPVLNDHGDIELKPQQGSSLNKHQNNTKPSNSNEATAEKKEAKE